MSTALHLTLDEFQQMINDDAFAAVRDRRIELIHGELREMSPPGPNHSEAVSWLTEWSVLTPPKSKVKVRIQDPIELPEQDSQPQPDVVWAKPRRYSDHHPRVEDIFLVIEVADSSLDSDLGEKADLYAAGGIQDYWVVNIPGQTVEILRRPVGGKYSQRTTHLFGERIASLAFPDVLLDVTALFAPLP
jgi:Uma2 family endonuclease